MIHYTTGNILDADTEALVNTVNCVGVMGRGIALQFKSRFPDNFKAYGAACKQKQIEPGKVFVFDTGELVYPRYIINFPTKRHWRGKSRIEDIEAGLVDLKEALTRLEIRSIAIPPLGAGLGGLQWETVKSRIESALSEIDNVAITVYEPSEQYKESRVNRSTKVPDMTPGRSALVSLMARYLDGLMDPSISLLEVHKLMYFLQAAGEPLKLRYVQGAYGPYAENLTHVLREIEGHMVSGYADGGDMPDKQLSLVPGAAEEARSFLADKTDTLQRFERVSALVDGFETPFGLELLATVHWIMTESEPKSDQEIEALTYQWNERKRQFSAAQIALAAQHLRRFGWHSLRTGA